MIDRFIAWLDRVADRQIRKSRKLLDRAERERNGGEP